MVAYRSLIIMLVKILVIFALSSFEIVTSLIPSWRAGKYSFTKKSLVLFLVGARILSARRVMTVSTTNQGKMRDIPVDRKAAKVI